MDALFLHFWDFDRNTFAGGKENRKLVYRVRVTKLSRWYQPFRLSVCELLFVLKTWVFFRRGNIQSSSFIIVQCKTRLMESDEGMGYCGVYHFWIHPQGRCSTCRLRLKNFENRFSIERSRTGGRSTEDRLWLRIFSVDKNDMAYVVQAKSSHCLRDGWMQ